MHKKSCWFINWIKIPYLLISFTKNVFLSWNRIALAYYLQTIQQNTIFHIIPLEIFLKIKFTPEKSSTKEKNMVRIASWVNDGLRNPSQSRSLMFSLFKKKRKKRELCVMMKMLANYYGDNYFKIYVYQIKSTPCTN